MSDIDFKHEMAAHCETGTLRLQLNHKGLNLSESLVFGIAGGIFFGYFTGSKFAFPTFIVRSKPGDIRKKISKRLGIGIKTAKFKDQDKAEKALDELLDKNIPVAVQVDFFYMDYLPAYLRVHINVHFINVVGKRGDNYLVSDCYYPQIVELSRESLRKGRFPGGNMSPDGFMYYIENIPSDIEYKKAVKKGIKKACYNMLKLPIPFIGIKGMRKFASHISEWPKYALDNEYLSHEVTKINILLEDQGTGGAGFRFMYATFLKQAAEILNEKELVRFSKEMMDNGDEWRKISLYAARMGKNRELGVEKLKELGQMIMKRADFEEKFFKELYKFIS
jgi:hypothetical protein